MYLIIFGTHIVKFYYGSENIYTISHIVNDDGGGDG